MGDPAGVGPEIIVKALAANPSLDTVVYGDPGVFRRVMEVRGMPKFKLKVISKPSERAPERLNVIPSCPGFDASSMTPGKEDAACGMAAWECVKAAVADCLEGKTSAVATAPVNKVSLRMAGVPHTGHTEMFAALTNTPDPLTMFQTRGMRIFFLTRHVSLRDACDMVTRECLLDYIPRCIRALQDLGPMRGDLAVAGLNPHCGDGGQFGEEEKVIREAVWECSSIGLPVKGPVSADSVFAQCLKGKWAGVLSLYHDQGHIAAKTVDFDRTVSLTLGMPILRVSVDHGTAFDIAWKGIASADGMEECLQVASSLRP